MPRHTVEAQAARSTAGAACQRDSVYRVRKTGLRCQRRIEDLVIIHTSYNNMFAARLTTGTVAGCARCSRPTAVPVRRRAVARAGTNKIVGKPARQRINLNACGIVAPAPAARGRPAEQEHRASRRPCAVLEAVCCAVECRAGSRYNVSTCTQKTEELLTSRPPVCTYSRVPQVSTHCVVVPQPQQPLSV
jgi:hypothetical protein